MELLRTLREGVLDKGMPAWKNVVDPQDLAATAVYVRGLRGTRPSNAKAPQGELVKP